MADSCSSCYVTIVQHHNLQIIFEVCSKLQRRRSNCTLKHCDGNTNAHHSVVSHASILLHPNVVLIAIIITTIIGIIDYQAAFRLWKANKIDFLCLYKLLRCSLLSLPLGLAISNVVVQDSASCHETKHKLSRKRTRNSNLPKPWKI
ncbi:putative sulfate transporter 3.4 [Bienertia sinuspersici]